jgi:hypothetical protein
MSRIVELLETLVKRVSSIERRLDNHVKFEYKCNLQEDTKLFMEISLKKRLPEYLVRSAAESNFITDADVDTIHSLFREALPVPGSRGALEVTIHTLEQKDWYDACVRLIVEMPRPASKHEKVTMYENIERTLKMRLGDLFELSPVYSNRYVGYRIFDRRTLAL